MVEGETASGSGIEEVDRSGADRSLRRIGLCLSCELR
jgi:hypothetical protein